MSEGITADQMESGVLTVLSAPFELTNGQVLTWHTNAIPVLPATETLNYSSDPTELFWPIGLVLVINTLGAAYDNVDPTAQYRVSIGSDRSDTVIFVSELSLNNPLTAQNLFMNSMFGIGNSDTANSTPEDPHLHSLIPLKMRLHHNLQDNAVVVSLRNGDAGNLTGGHPDNYIKGEVLYRRLAIP